jgi:type 1 glutamine amidotransferase
MSRRKFFPLLIPFALLCWSCVCCAAQNQKKVVLIAGSITSHPKEAHEYEKNVILLKHLLDTSPDLQGKVRVEVHFHGWPKDPSTLENADTIFLTSDGTDREEKNHPLYVGDHLQVIEREMKRGCGLVFFHWSTFNPVRVHDRITEWVGGYFDYENGTAPNHWFSAIQTWKAESRPGTQEHPILRGVKPFTTQEEYYYRLRFRDNDARLKPIVVTRPPKETNEFAVGWAVERADGGRGFGFTGGHFYANWWNADFRKLILNAIVWTARLDVPPAGVRSQPFERFKALILTGHNHPAHDWRATTAAQIPVLEQDPRAIVHVTENPEDLANPSRSPRREDGEGSTLPPHVGGYTIFDYDLVVLNYCNWERQGLSDAAKANFTRYLTNGGGLAIIHFANGAWHPSLPNTKPADAWSEYSTRICRRVWEHRPPNASSHDAFGPFHVEIASAKHAITEGLQPFDTVDELYFHQAGELPIEPLAFAVSKETKQRESMAWAYDYGKGRVFQTVLGHADESIRKAAGLIRRGCVWAAGRNELAFDPPPELTEGALFREGSPWTPQGSLKRGAGILPAEKAESARAAAPPAAPGASATAAGPGDAASRTSRGSGPRPAGTPTTAASEPEAQQEKDWIDNRWSRTDVGQFLGSTLRVPNGTVTRALSIRVGDHDEASVCFDTVNLNLRAAWTGGFLKYDAARFGLLNLPKMDGQVQFVAPEGPGWTGATGRFSGFHVHGRRVVLEYQLGDTTVRESPWFQETGGYSFFTREFEIDPHRIPFRVKLASVTGSGDPWRFNDPTGSGYLVTNDQQALAVTCFGLGRAEIIRTNGGIELVIRSAPSKQRFVLSIWSGSPDKASSAPLNIRSFRPGLDSFLDPGPARWLPALQTTGHVAPDTGPLAIDTLTVPYDNPWNALMFLSGVDFTSDGAAYVCSIHGDVWKVTGIDDRLQKLSWKRFATGLYQPLGLKVVNDQVYVLGRDQITRLHDENGDGEADFYEDFCNLIRTSPDAHNYVTSLEADAAGNFYYADPRGVHRVSPDGRRAETLATGFRNPNGLGASPDGMIVTVAPQQGEWTPSSSIIEAKRGGYYGYGGPKLTAERPLGYDPVLCWIPHSVDNSGGSQIWVPEGGTGASPVSSNWGPLGGQLFHFSWGRCSMMLVLRDVVDGVAQGATVALPGRFLSGAMRGAFNPRDGHLYVVGSTGWQTSALKDGCLQRVRYTGKPLSVPLAWHAQHNGLTLTFTQPLEKETAEDVGSYDVEQWNYRYAAQYGSKDWSVANPNREGHDTLDVRSAKLLADGRTVYLEIPSLKPVMQLQVQYNLSAKDGASMRGKLYATINRLPSATSADLH